MFDAFIVLSGNTSSYTVFYTNNGGVAVSDRPYIELIYEDGTVGYRHTDGLHRCQMYYRHSDGVHLVQPFYMAADGLHKIST